MEKISVVIPCYNSEKSIKIIVEKIVQIMDSNSEYDYEIVLVNDHSLDATWEVLKKIAYNNKRITAIDLSKNYGQHSAIMAGYREVTGDYIIGMDDDGEHDPKDIFKLVDKLKEGYDYVCAEYEENRSKFRNFGTMMNNKMAEILIDKPKEVIFTSFYGMRRYVVEEMIRYEQPYPYIAGLLLRVTHNIGTVPMKRGNRIYGKSGYNLTKMLRLWINGFTAFSVKPLRIATGVGIGVACIGIIWAIVLMIKKLFIQDYVAGYVSIIVALAIFSGIIMIMLGMIGEYIGRIYISINNAPQYVIREKIKDGDESENKHKKVTEDKT